MLPSAQRIFDAARFLVALGNLAAVEHSDRLQWLIGRTPSAAIEAYDQARYWAGTSPDRSDRDVYEGVAGVIASRAAMIGVEVG